MPTFSNLVNLLNPSAPKGIIYRADDWVERRRKRLPQMREPQPAAHCKTIFPEEENLHIIDQTTADAPYAEYQNLRWTTTEKATLFYFSGARLLGREGAVISPDNRVFAEFTLPPERRWLEHSAFKRRRIPEVTHLKGWYATIAWPESEFYFHWMMESLPRMALLRDQLAVLDGIFVCGKLHKFHVEALSAIGVPEHKLIELQPGSHFQPQHLFVPRAFAMYNPARWMVDWYRQSFLSNSAETRSLTDSPRRIYISRADAPARRIANEAEVVDLLQKHDFATVTLSQLSFLDQVQIFAQADVVVAGHGAGLSNLVFCRPQTKVLEIMPPQWMAPCFMSLATIVGCEYRFVVGGVAFEPSAQLSPQRADVVAPLALLATTLKDLL